MLLYSVLIVLVFGLTLVFIYEENVFPNTQRNVYTMEDVEGYFRENGIDIIKDSVNTLIINHQYGKQYSIKQTPNYQLEFYIYKNKQQREYAEEEFLYKTSNLDIEDCKLYSVKNVLAVLEGVNTKDEVYKKIDSIIGRLDR
ncbi:hypothetical protein [Clostridium oryzae]|uniref:DUF4825 domain-containing protein n=1 Tax=Clostridium oryzae TaxID=1450648 RepID=A0A1V4ITL3_9CLOT|nr:hypothetical protein [Clostridium oryzae]OPJ63362.1 hypothetical protein CLORY_11440 [Clostridium oryzae]